MRLLMRSLAWLPLSVLYRMGDGLHVLVFHVLRWRVALSRRNLAGAFPDVPITEREATLRTSYRNLARTLMEAIWGFHASKEALLARVRFDNPEIIEEYKERRVPLVLLTAHLCNWEWLLLAAGARFGFPIDVIYKPIRVPGVEAYVREARSRFGGNPVPFTSFLFELMSRGDGHRAYAMVADQTPTKKMPKHWTRFLNRDTAFYLGPEKVARFLDAPVLYVEMTRVKLGHYAVRFHLLAEPPYDEGAGALIAERYARALETTIVSHPADWLWLHNKWKYARDG
ncbi:MAG TPA: lysophospholipid acyltransferase family protein [Casimicrobiaceae bacterium]|nr:lysophospholipid acyltransferase family protein [Casimicrobiaceae bacterium]